MVVQTAKLVLTTLTEKNVTLTQKNNILEEALCNYHGITIMDNFLSIILETKIFY